MEMKDNPLPWPGGRPKPKAPQAESTKADAKNAPKQTEEKAGKSSSAEMQMELFPDPKDVPWGLNVLFNMEGRRDAR